MTTRPAPRALAPASAGGAGEAASAPVEGAKVHDGVEEGLAARAAAGDAGAFDALVTLFGGRVFSVALRLLRDRGEAEDLTQEVFVALYHHLPDFRGESRLSTWIYRITKNRALNRLKFLKRRQHGNHADVDDPAVSRFVRDPDTGAGEERDPERKLAGHALSAVLEHHLRELPEEQRALVILRDLEDLSYEEIAEVTGLPLGTVKSRLHRARAELALRLRPHLADL
ncbi:MAG: sigma-70 family RNA polymerase sigma factor [Deltaproteobacteria bacterium]|nr:sigma-70 family RNA polymerase sigma factor [Deltaproteobacteria bacterium]